MLLSSMGRISGKAQVSQKYEGIKVRSAFVDAAFIYAPHKRRVDS